MPLWVQVPIPAAWFVIDWRQFLPSRHFSLDLTEKQGKGVDCNGSSLPLFSIRSLLWIPDDAAKHLESLDLVEHVDDQKRFREYPYSLVYFAAFSIRGWAFWNSSEQRLDVKREQCQNCSRISVLVIFELDPAIDSVFVHRRTSHVISSCTVRTLNCLHASLHLHAFHIERLSDCSLSVPRRVPFPCVSPITCSSLPTSTCTLSWTSSFMWTTPRQLTTGTPPTEDSGTLAEFTPPTGTPNLKVRTYLWAR